MSLQTPLTTLQNIAKMKKLQGTLPYQGTYTSICSNIRLKTSNMPQTPHQNDVKLSHETNTMPKFCHEQQPTTSLKYGKPALCLLALQRATLLLITS